MYFWPYYVGLLLLLIVKGVTDVFALVFIIMHVFIANAYVYSLSLSRNPIYKKRLAHQLRSDRTYNPIQILNVWDCMLMVVTVKTLLSEVVNPVEVASFSANVLANVVSAAFKVIFVLMNSVYVYGKRCNGKYLGSWRLTVSCHGAFTSIVLTFDSCSPSLRIPGCWSCFVSSWGVCKGNRDDDWHVDSVETTTPLSETVWSYLPVLSLYTSIALSISYPYSSFFGRLSREMWLTVHSNLSSSRSRHFFAAELRPWSHDVNSESFNRHSSILPWRVLAQVHHCPADAPQFLYTHQLSSTRSFLSERDTYAEGLENETARAWIRSPALVPMPAQSARRSSCGLGATGRTRVVVASRIHDWVGPREKYGPKPTVSCPATRLADAASRDSSAVDFIVLLSMGRCLR